MTKALAAIFLITFALKALAAATSTESYKRSVPECHTCEELNDLLSKYASTLSPSDRIDIALHVAKTIEKITLKEKNTDQRRRELHFAINASLEVLTDDFNSETAVQLLDKRQDAPAEFDYVFWRFQLPQQKRLLARMKSFVDDKIRPKAKLPEPKEVE
jgi:hypothetical protein